MNSKELQEAMALRERAMTRVKNEINRIMVSRPQILGLDGNALGNAQEQMADEVMALMRSYIEAPTMMEQEAVPTLAQNSIEGASLSLMSLLTFTVFEPTKELAPQMASMIPHIFMFIMGYAKENSPIPQNGLTDVVKDVSGMVNIAAVDGEGRPLVMGEELENMKLAACNELVIALTSQCVTMGFLSMTEESLEITPLGDRLLRHLISVNHWIQTIQLAVSDPSSLIVQG